MQKEDNNNSDLFLRSMIQQAEESVPEGVWDAVSDRLDQLEAHRRAALWWRRAAIGIAAAAAIALGVMLFPDKDHSNQPIYTNDSASLLADDHSSTVSGDDSEATLLPQGQAPEVDMAVSSAGKRTASNIVPNQSFRVRETMEDVTLPSRDAVPSNDALQADIAEIQADSGEEVMTVAVDDSRTAVSSDESTSQGELPLRSSSDSPSVSDGSAAKGMTITPDDSSDESVERDAFAKWELMSRYGKPSTPKLSLTAGGLLANNENPASTARYRMSASRGIAAPTKTTIEQVSRESTYSIPVSAGMGLRVGLIPRIAIGSGVNWTMLGRSFTGIYREVENGDLVRSISTDVHNTVHYVGVPLNLYFTFLSSDHVSAYLYGGGEVEKAVTSRFKIDDRSGPIYHNEKVDGVQLSAGAGLGVTFHLTKHVGLYIDPGFRYFFDCSQPVSIRTQQPFMMTFETGLRFDL